MKLYHYTPYLYRELLTRKARLPRNRSIEGTNNPNESLTEASYMDSVKRAKDFSQVGSYNDHISFFIDPIPSGMIGTLFENHHHSWYNGNMLFEHVIDTADIPQGFLFEIVETPIDIETLDKTQWVDTDAFVKRYMFNMAAVKIANGERGKGKPSLDKQILRFTGCTEQAYTAAKKRHDWEDNKTKYAACVPHVMVYPPGGTIPVRTVNKIVIGSNARKPFNVSSEALTSLLW
jgi:hypothetical protein